MVAIYHRGMRVFVVDDASFIRILCRHYIQKAGYEVCGEAYDGAQALEDIRKTQPDCVIMDLALPSINGVDIMKKINREYPHIQFVVVSSLDKNFCDTRLESVEYLQFLTKPFEPEHLKKALDLASQHMEKLQHG